MKITFTFRIYLFSVAFGIFFVTSLQAQQVTGSPQNKKQGEDKWMKAMGVDSVPSTIFLPRKELTETEKEAQRLYTEGIKKGKSEDYEGAITDLSQSISLAENENAFLKRGYAYLFSKQYPLALQDFTECLRLSPGNKDAILGRGLARFEMKDYAGAEVDIKQYIDQVDINPMAYNYTAAICMMRQDFQCAFQNYSDVIRCDSLYLDAYAYRALTRHYLQDYKGALEDFEIAIEQNPKDKKNYNNRGASKMMLKDFNAALEDYNKAIELDSLYADAYNNRGRVRFTLGDTEGACTDWQQALSLGIETSRDLINKNCK